MTTPCPDGCEFRADPCVSDDMPCPFHQQGQRHRAGRAGPDRPPSVLDKIEEIEEWLTNWRNDQFSPTYDRRGWPIEMHGLALDVEWLIMVVKADRRA